jgi:hypothetical protein
MPVPAMAIPLAPIVRVAVTGTLYIAFAALGPADCVTATDHAVSGAAGVALAAAGLADPVAAAR